VKSIDYFIRLLVNSAAIFSMVVMLGLALLGTVEVLGTSLLGMPLPSVREISSEALVLLIFGGFGYAQLRDEHVAVDLFYSRFTPRIKHVVRIFSRVLGLSLFAVFTARLGASAWNSYEIGERASALIAFSIWPFKALASVGSGIAALEYLRQLLYLCVGRNPLDGCLTTKETSV
jgi:TRAP-type mannitol/chloroaromatic compound transport system permease small subunit